MGTVSKKELTDRVCNRLGDGKSRTLVREAIQAFLDQVIEELAKGNRLEFRDFGVFETKLRAARKAQNPKTLQRVDVPPRRTVKFKVGHLMREALDKAMASEPPPPAGEVKGETGSARLKSA